MKIKYNGLLNRFNHFVAEPLYRKNPFNKSFNTQWVDGEKKQLEMKQMNICEYFWRTVFNVFMMMALLAVLVMFAGIALSPVAALLLIVFDQQWVNPAYASSGFILTVFAICWGLLSLIGKALKLCRGKREKAEKDSLIKEYLKARKSKFCKNVEVDYD